VVGDMYDDTFGLLEKEGETLKWGNVYQMFKKKNFSIDVEDHDELKIFKNIRKSRIFRVEAMICIPLCRFHHLDPKKYIFERHIHL
jgi:hypothetical protein